MNTFSVADFRSKVQPSHCHITTTKGIYNIPLDDILFIESCQKKTILHLKYGTLLLPLPLYHLKNVLPSPLFLQTHRSFIINLNNISYINKQKDPWVVFFYATKEQAYISRSFRHQVMAAVTLSD